MAYTEDDLIEMYRQASEEKGRGLTSEEWRTHEDTTAQSVVYRLFDSFPDFREAAGYPAENPKLASDEELIEEILELADELGRQPTQDDMKEQGEYSQSTYERAFGSWGEGLEAAGFENPQTICTEEDIRECKQALEEAIEHPDADIWVTMTAEGPKNQLEHHLYPEGPYGYPPVKSERQALEEIVNHEIEVKVQ